MLAVLYWTSLGVSLCLLILCLLYCSLRRQVLVPQPHLSPHPMSTYQKQSRVELDLNCWKGCVETPSQGLCVDCLWYLIWCPVQPGKLQHTDNKIKHDKTMINDNLHRNVLENRAKHCLDASLENWWTKHVLFYNLNIPIAHHNCWNYPRTSLQVWFSWDLLTSAMKPNALPWSPIIHKGNPDFSNTFLASQCLLDIFSPIFPSAKDAPNEQRSVWS